MKVFTLADYYKESSLPVYPEWSEQVIMKNKPFRHQVGDLNFLACYTRCGLYNQAGTGKTLPAQAYGIWIASQGNKVVYIMPPVLTTQFSQSLKGNFKGIEAAVSIGVLKGYPVKRKAMIDKWVDDWPDLLIMSYRMFVNYHTDLKRNGYTCVVVDEATAVKNATSQLHAAVKVFGGNARKDSNGIVLMTGSPVDTNVSDAYGLIATIDPDRYGSRKAFEKRHCIFQRKSEDSKYEMIVGYKDYDYLNRSLFMTGRRILKKDVSDLPPRLITEIPITLSRKHRELYQQIVDERLAMVQGRLLDMTEASALYQAMQRLLISPEQFTDKEINNNLLETLDTLLETLAGKKVVIYCWYQNSIEKLKERYKHLNPAVLNGKITGSRRDREKMKFIEDDSCRIILANPRSGGVGVDGFQDVSSYVIFAEVCPFVGIFDQAISRLHRTGQKAESVNVYMLIPTGTIAVKLRNDLLRKDMQQELTVRDKRTILNNLMGDGGMKGSLDEIPLVSKQLDSAILVDNYQE